MNTVRKLAIVIGGLSAFATTAHAQGPSNPASASISANGAIAVIQPISVAKNSDLNFGTVVRPRSGGATIAITADGTPTFTGTTAVNATNNPAKAASFTISGEGGSAYSVTVPGSFTMANQNGAGSLTVTTVNNVTNTPLDGSIGSSASATFGVGGTVNIDNTTVSGAYTGTFTVTASYN